MGHQGVRALGRLDRWLGPGGVGDHRARQRGRGRRRLPTAVPPPRFLGREHLDQGAAGQRPDRDDDLGQHPRHRHQRADAERPDHRSVRCPHHRQRDRPRQGRARQGRPTGNQSRAQLAVAEWPEFVGDRRSRHPLHLHLLGLGRLPGRRRGDQGLRENTGPGCCPHHDHPGLHLRPGRLRHPVVCRIRRHRHRPEQRRERRRRADHPR